MIGVRAGTGHLVLRSGAVRQEIPLAVLAEPAHLHLAPPNPVVTANGELTLHLVATDAAGDPLGLPSTVTWSAEGGTIDAGGRLHVGTRNVAVHARVGAATLHAAVSVGEHDVSLPIIDAPNVSRWSFMTVPRGGPGSLSDDGGLRLAYDFTGDERAAYARAHVELGGLPESIGIDIDGDGHGAAVRATIVDAHNQTASLTFTRAIDWIGTRHCVARIPPALTPPLTVTHFYVVGTLNDTPVHASGAITLRHARVVFAGSDTPRPLFVWQDAF